MTIGMTPYWYDEEYSVLQVGGMTSPGSVVLSGHDRKANYDKQKGSGQEGETLLRKGDSSGEFDATFFLASEPDAITYLTDFDAWEDFQRYLAQIKKLGLVVPVYHPDLARNEFTAVTVFEIGGLVHDGKGGATVRVKFGEYRQARPKPAKKTTSAPGGANAVAGGVPVKPDPNARRKAELAALLVEARKPT